jgi:hypothetical protein
MTSSLSRTQIDQHQPLAANDNDPDSLLQTVAFLLQRNNFISYPD